MRPTGRRVTFARCWQAAIVAAPKVGAASRAAHGSSGRIFLTAKFVRLGSPDKVCSKGPPRLGGPTEYNAKLRLVDVSCARRRHDFRLLERDGVAGRVAGIDRRELFSIATVCPTARAH